MTILFCKQRQIVASNVVQDMRFVLCGTRHSDLSASYSCSLRDSKLSTVHFKLHHIIYLSTESTWPVTCANK